MPVVTHKFGQIIRKVVQGGERCIRGWRRCCGVCLSRCRRWRQFSLKSVRIADRYRKTPFATGALIHCVPFGEENLVHHRDYATFLASPRRYGSLKAVVTTQYGPPSDVLQLTAA